MARRKATKEVTEHASTAAAHGVELEESDAGVEGGLRGLGARSMALLAEEGLTTREQVEEVGPAEVFRRLRLRHPDKITNTLLWQLAGALLDLDWRELPSDMKQHLLFEVEACVQRAAKARAK
mgnify:CR=1 FL=1